MGLYEGYYRDPFPHSLLRTRQNTSQTCASQALPKPQTLNPKALKPNPLNPEPWSPHISVTSEEGPTYGSKVLRIGESRGSLSVGALVNKSSNGNDGNNSNTSNVVVIVVVIVVIVIIVIIKTRFLLGVF